MDGIKGKSNITQYQMSHYDPHIEIRDMFRQLSAWREESQSTFSTISNSIEKGISDLIDEVCDLKSKLSVTIDERNILLETVNNMNCNIRQANDKLPLLQNLTETI